MPIFRVASTTIVEFEVRGHDLENAVTAAMEDYSWEREPGGRIRRRETKSFSVVADQIEPDPPCQILDGAAICCLPATRWSKGTEEWVCEKHAKAGVA